METEVKKKSSAIGCILKGLILLVVIVVVIVVGGYFLLKYVKGVDIIALIGQLDKISTSVEPDKYIDNPYSFEDSKSALQKLVDAGMEDDTMWFDEENKLQYDEEKFERINLSEDLLLSDSELVAWFNSCVGFKYGEDGIVSDDMFSINELKFDNYVESSKSVDVTMVLVVDLGKFLLENVDSEIGAIKDLLPETIVIKSVFTLKKLGQYDVSIKSKSLAINDLDEEECVEFFQNLSNLLINIDIGELNESIVDQIVISVFGKNGLCGFMTIISNLKDFDFSSQNGKIYAVFRVND